MQKEKQFKLFFDKYCKMQLYNAMKFINNLQAAEEIVHDCFIGIWRHWDKLLTDTDKLNYLYKSVYNKCITFKQKNNNTNIQFSEEHSQQEWYLIQINSCLLNKIITEMHTYADVLRPLSHNRIMHMLIDGFSAAEISKQLEVSQKTVYYVKNMYMQKLIKAVLP